MTTLVEFQRHFKKSRKPITQEDIKPIIDFPYRWINSRLARLTLF